MYDIGKIIMLLHTWLSDWIVL